MSSTPASTTPASTPPTSTTRGPGGLDWPAAAAALQDQVDDLTAAVTALQRTVLEQAAEIHSLQASPAAAQPASPSDDPRGPSRQAG